MTPTQKIKLAILQKAFENKDFVIKGHNLLDNLNGNYYGEQIDQAYNAIELFELPISVWHNHINRTNGFYWYNDCYVEHIVPHVTNKLFL